MKRASAKNLSTSPQQMTCGLFSKKEAAQLIGKGTRHLHSSTLGESEPCAKITQHCLSEMEIRHYPWEQIAEAPESFLTASSDRYDIINRLLTSGAASPKRELKEKVHIVLEELLTNAIYHGYRNQDGTRRFPRRNSAVLSDREKVGIRFRYSPQGIYLAVRDQAGSLAFEDISRAIARCYSGSGEQIESKESGAGLGTYMVFEAVTHLKIVSEPSKSCTFSVWIAENQFYDPDTFSFNFYEGR